MVSAIIESMSAIELPSLLIRRSFLHARFRPVPQPGQRCATAGRPAKPEPLHLRPQ